MRRQYRVFLDRSGQVPGVYSAGIVRLYYVLDGPVAQSDLSALHNLPRTKAGVRPSYPRVPNQDVWSLRPDIEDAVVKQGAKIGECGGDDVHLGGRGNFQTPSVDGYERHRPKMPAHRKSSLILHKGESPDGT